MFPRSPLSLPRFVHLHFSGICTRLASYTHQIEFVTLPRSLAIHTSCPQLDSSTSAISVVARAALLPCILSITVRVKDTEGRPIRNQTIDVSESFTISTFSVNSPFLPPGQIFVRGDGSSGSNMYCIHKSLSTLLFFIRRLRPLRSSKFVCLHSQCSSFRHCRSFVERFHFADDPQQLSSHYRRRWAGHCSNICTSIPAW